MAQRHVVWRWRCGRDHGAADSTADTCCRTEDVFDRVMKRDGGAVQEPDPILCGVGDVRVVLDGGEATDAA